MSRPDTIPAPSIIVTNRSVLAIAVPMTLAYLTTPLLGVVDTAVVGQFGDAALIGGLAAGAIVFDVVFSTFNFLRSGTTGLVAQANGRRDDAEERTVFWRAAALAATIGIVLILVSPLVALAGAWFMEAGPRVTEALETYVRIRLLSAPLALLNYAVLGYLLGRAEAGKTLLLQLVLNGANVVLSIWLGLSLGWGVAGVAWGTVGAEAFACIAGLAFLLRRFRNAPALPLARIFDPASMLAMLSLNRDIMIRSFALLAAFALFARQGAAFGTLTLAANAVLMNFFLVAGYFLDGFASAAEQLAGKALGARDGNAFRRTVTLTTIWGLALAGGAAGILLLFGGDFVAIMTSAVDVRTEATAYLPWAALTALSGVLAFQMDGVFIGTTWSRDMRNAMLFSLVVFLGALYVLPAAFGNNGLWAALHVFLLARGLTLFAILPRRARAAFAAE